MPILNKGETFVDGQQVSGQRLNDLIDNATALPELITTQTPIADPVADGDGLLIHDASAAALRKITVQEMFAGDIALSSSVVTTSVVNGQTGADIAINPNNGTTVAGSAFTSVDGITVTVNSVAHGLVAGQFILVAASDAAYSGTFLIASYTANSFTYLTLTEQTPASGTCTYTKQGAVDVNGNLLVSDNVIVGQDVGIAGSAQIDGALNANGAINSSGSATFSGFADFTGVLKVNNQVAYLLVGITEHDIPYWQATYAGHYNSVYTSPTFTKPSEEIWVIELMVTSVGTGYDFEYAVRLGSQTTLTGQYLSIHQYQDAGGGGNFYRNTETHRYVFPAGVVMTDETLRIDTFASNGSSMRMFATTQTTGTVYTSATQKASVFRIYKYKTAVVPVP
jgi:hypothetical protein